MSDTFKKVYQPLHPVNSQIIVNMKQAFEAVEAFTGLVKSREMSIAITNLEQASMWATKAIVLEDEKNGGVPIVCSTDAA